MYYRRRGNQWVPTDVNLTDKQMVYRFIERNPKASVRAIRKGAGVRNERVGDILAEGSQSGELLMTGFWRAQLYSLTELGVKAMNAPPPPRWWEIPIPVRSPLRPHEAWSHR